MLIPGGEMAYHRCIQGVLVGLYHPTTNQTCQESPFIFASSYILWLATNPMECETDAIVSDH